MGFERNDVVFKNRLAEALNEENEMGFEHNDIVTVNVMEKAIEEGGGGGGLSTAKVSFVSVDEGTGTFNSPFIFIYEYEGTRTLDNYTPGDTIPFGDVCDVVLVDGAYEFAVSPVSSEVLVSGGAELTGNTITVTGDCTVTLAFDK